MQHPRTRRAARDGYRFRGAVAETDSWRHSRMLVLPGRGQCQICLDAAAWRASSIARADGGRTCQA